MDKISNSIKPKINKPSIITELKKITTQSQIDYDTQNKIKELKNQNMELTKIVATIVAKCNFSRDARTLIEIRRMVDSL